MVSCRAATQAVAATGQNEGDVHRGAESRQKTANSCIARPSAAPEGDAPSSEARAVRLTGCRGPNSRSSVEARNEDR